MGEFPYLLWIAPFVTFALLTYGILLYCNHRRIIKDRFKKVTSSSLPLFQRKEENNLKKQLLEWISFLSKWSIKDKEEVSKVRISLLHAGYRHPKAPAIFFGIKALTAFILPVPYLMGKAVNGNLTLSHVATALVIAGVGFYLPQYVLNTLARRRQDRIDKALPDVLDLLIVCMEAGLSLQATLNRVSDEVRSISSDLFNEFQVTNAELRTGIPRETALRSLGERTGVQNVKALVGLMIQSERMGASIAQALRTHASFLRVQRAQKAEEKAAKLPVKILFPMLFFIFPAIFIVILGPAVIQVSKSSFFTH
jgi:tight adherence protein C